MFIIGIIANSAQAKQIEKEIKQEELNVKIIWVNYKNIENLKNIKFEIIIMQNIGENLKQNKEEVKNLVKNSRYILLNTDTNIDSKMFEETKAQIITYGLKQKSTITTSSIEENQTIVSIQRSFKNMQGKVVERQEIPTELNKKGINNVYNTLIKTSIINIQGAKNS